jgi:hypothetical protein
MGISQILESDKVIENSITMKDLIRVHTGCAIGVCNICTKVSLNNFFVTHADAGNKLQGGSYAFPYSKRTGYKRV